MSNINFEKFLLSVFKQTGDIPESWKNALLEQNLEFNPNTQSFDEVKKSTKKTRFDIEKGKWYVCVKTWVEVPGLYEEGKMYYSPAENYLRADNGLSYPWFGNSATKYFQVADESTSIKGYKITELTEEDKKKFEQLELKLQEEDPNYPYRANGLKPGLSADEQLYWQRGFNFGMNMFEIGDWIVDTRDKSVYQVKSKDDSSYIVDGHFHIGYFEADMCFRKWDVCEDGKNGEILYHEPAHCIIIYNGKIFDGEPGAYLGVDTHTKELEIWEVEDRQYCSAHLVPASDSQKEFLRDALAEAGYYWNKYDLKLVKLKFKIGDLIETKNEEPLVITEIKNGSYYSCDLCICSFDEQDKWTYVGTSVVNGCLSDKTRGRLDATYEEPEITDEDDDDDEEENKNFSIKDLNNYQRKVFVAISPFAFQDEKITNKSIIRLSNELVKLAYTEIADSFKQCVIDRKVCQFKNSSRRFLDKRVADIYRAGIEDCVKMIRDKKDEEV